MARDLFEQTPILDRKRNNNMGDKTASVALPGLAARIGALGILPLYLWIVLNGMDALLTWRGIPMGASEANPALAALAHHTSVPTMLLIKLLIAGILGLAIWQRRKLLMLIALDMFMLTIVTFNAAVIAFFL